MSRQNDDLKWGDDLKWETYQGSQMLRGGRIRRTINVSFDGHVFTKLEIVLSSPQTCPWVENRNFQRLLSGRIDLLQRQLVWLASFLYLEEVTILDERMEIVTTQVNTRGQHSLWVKLPMLVVLRLPFPASLLELSEEERDRRLTSPKAKEAITDIAKRVGPAIARSNKYFQGSCNYANPYDIRVTEDWVEGDR